MNNSVINDNMARRIIVLFALVIIIMIFDVGMVWAEQSKEELVSLFESANIVCEDSSSNNVKLVLYDSQGSSQAFLDANKYVLLYYKDNNGEYKYLGVSHYEHEYYSFSKTEIIKHKDDELYLVVGFPTGQYSGGNYLTIPSLDVEGVICSMPFPSDVKETIVNDYNSSQTSSTSGGNNSPQTADPLLEPYTANPFDDMYDPNNEKLHIVNSQTYGNIRLVDVASSYGYVTNYDPNNYKEVGEGLKPVIAAIMGALALLAGAVAVGMLIAIGIKYMSKGAGFKAEVKDTLLPYFIGAVLISGATTLASIALSLVKK